MIPFIYNDGGRAEAGYRGRTGDCVVRSIAIATEIPYKEVYRDLTRLGKSSPRNGVRKEIYTHYLKSLGWKWKSCMGIGTGCTTHLRVDELPSGKIIVRVTKHLCAVVDGVLNDTWNPSRDGMRCVYGYFYKT